MKSLVDIIKSGDVDEFDRRLQQGFRRDGGVGEEIRQGNVVERFTQAGRSLKEAYEIASQPQPKLDGKSLLGACYSHEGWLDARIVMEELYGIPRTTCA